MQPLQCVLQHHVASPHAFSAHGIKPSQQLCSHHTSICNHRFQNALCLRTPRTTAQCRTPCRHQSYVKGTPAATASQTSCPSLAAAATLREKQSVSRRGVLPNTSPHVVPCNSHAAITMRFAASRGIPACISAHGIKPSQQLCSHHTCDLQPQVPKRPMPTHTRTTAQCRTFLQTPFTHQSVSQQQPLQRRAALHWRLQPPYAKNEVFRAQASSQQDPCSPMQHSCKHCNAFRSRA